MQAKGGSKHDGGYTKGNFGLLEAVFMRVQSDGSLLKDERYDGEVGLVPCLMLGRSIGCWLQQNEGS